MLKTRGAWASEEEFCDSSSVLRSILKWFQVQQLINLYKLKLYHIDANLTNYITCSVWAERCGSHGWTYKSRCTGLLAGWLVESLGPEKHELDLSEEKTMDPQWNLYWWTAKVSGVRHRYSRRNDFLITCTPAIVNKRKLSALPTQHNVNRLTSSVRNHMSILSVHDCYFWF